MSDTPTAVRSGLRMWIPAIGWLSTYQPRWLRGDAVAGLTAAAVVVPQAMAYAALAGLPIQVGLYTALVPMLVYALFGASRVLSVSVTSTVSILVAAALLSVPPEQRIDAAFALAVLVGVLLIVAGLLKLGFLADFISLPVLAGFKTGAGLLIAASQLGKVLGVPVEGDGFFDRIVSAAAQLGATHTPTLILAAATVALILLLRRVSPAIPAPLVAVALGIVAASTLGLVDQGVAVVGPIPAGLPAFGAPPLALNDALFIPALGIALMVFVESIAAARAFAAPGDPKADASQEMVALGAASFVGGFFQSYPSSGGLSQSAVNRAAGACTPLASVVTAGVVALTLTALTGLFEMLPRATLGALVLVAAIGLVDTATLGRIAFVRRRDFVLAVVTLAGVLVLGVLDGVLIGVAVSILALLAQLSEGKVDILGRDPISGQWHASAPDTPLEAIPGLLVVRPYGMQYATNTERVRERILAAAATAEPSPRVVLIDASAVPDADVTALESFAQLRDDLRQRESDLWLASVYRTPRAMLLRAFAEDGSAPDWLFPDAVTAARAFSNPSNSRLPQDPDDGAGR